MKILVIGGHFSPALAVIESLPKDAEILYVGRKYALEGEKTFSLEYKAITSRNIPFELITTGRLQRKWTKHSLPSLLKLPVGFVEAFKIITTFKPTVILGFGSYVQVPLCVAGYLLKIPIVIHEQTLEAGLSNKLISKLAQKVCVSWEESSRFFPKEKVVITGNPVASGLFDNKFKNEKKENKYNLLIMGGSQGSHAINMLVKEKLAELVKDYYVSHQTGGAKEFNDFELLKEEKEKLPSILRERYTIVKFFDPSEVIEKIIKADLVISRAGMNTVATLLVLQKPSLLIPLPVSQSNEQIKNALFFKNKGLGEVLYQNSLTPEQFLSSIHAMIKNRSEYKNKNEKDINVHRDAVEKIIDVISYVEKNSAQKKN